MAAASTDFFTEVGNPGSATTLAAPGHSIAGTTFNVVSTSNWPTTTGAIFAVDTFTTQIIGGVSTAVRTPGSYTEWSGVVASSTQITGAVLRYGTDQNYSAGASTRVYIPVASSRENRLVQGMLVDHLESGRTAMATNFDPSNPTLETQKWAGVASAVNEVTVTNAATGNAPSAAATGGDTNIDLRLIPKGTGNVKRGATGGSIDWWEEIGRTILGSAGDTISITSITGKKYLKILISLLPSGSINGILRFNSDAGNNYAWRGVTNAADGTTASTSSITVNPDDAVAEKWAVYEIVNIAAQEKLVSGITQSQGATGAANVPLQRVVTGKWTNTSSQITRVDVLNVGAGDFAIGSEIIVLGHD